MIHVLNLKFHYHLFTIMLFQTTLHIIWMEKQYVGTESSLYIFGYCDSSWSCSCVGHMWRFSGPQLLSRSVSAGSAPAFRIQTISCFSWIMKCEFPFLLEWMLLNRVSYGCQRAVSVTPIYDHKTKVFFSFLNSLCTQTQLTNESRVCVCVSACVFCHVETDCSFARLWQAGC